jgi:hypothetical protein
MKTLYRCALAATLAGAAIGCGNEAEPTETPMDLDDGAMLAELALGSLDVRAAMTDDAVEPEAMMDPSLGDRWRLPRPVYKLLDTWDVVPPSSESGCITEHAPFIDEDQDGIPVDFALTFYCQGQKTALAHFSLDGGVRVDDANDHDRISGWVLEWTGLAIQRTFISGPKQGMVSRLFVDGSFQFLRNGQAFGFLEDYEIHATIENKSLGKTSSGRLSGESLFVYDPDDHDHPFVGGDVGFSGEKRFEHNGRKHRLTTETDPTLHFSAACRAEHPQKPGWDDGAIEYSNGATLRIEYTGCEEPVATLDGKPIPL